MIQCTELARRSVKNFGLNASNNTFALYDMTEYDGGIFSRHFSFNTKSIARVISKITAKLRVCKQSKKQTNKPSSVSLKILRELVSPHFDSSNKLMVIIL